MKKCNTFSWFSRPAHMRCLSAPLQNRQHPPSTSLPLSLSFPSLTAMRRGDGTTRVSAKIEGFPFILGCCPFLLFQLRHNCPSSVSSVESCTALSLFISHPLFCHPAVLERSTKLPVKSRTWDLFLTKSCTRSLVYKGWLTLITFYKRHCKVSTSLAS